MNKSGVDNFLMFSCGISFPMIVSILKIYILILIAHASFSVINGRTLLSCAFLSFVAFANAIQSSSGAVERDGILTGAGGKKWHTSTINKILRNEKYIGDALLQKTYTTDFLNKTRVKNNGLVPQYYVEGDHEAIIPKDIYLQVQEELVRRRVVKTSANGKKRSYSCNHCFSQIVICGECGEMFRRLH